MSSTRAHHTARVPALDGLRGLALLGVLGFHANGLLKGGYLGVDLFFVLSGFLITRLLLSEQREEGSIELGRFWIRRARRLFPALLSLMPAIGLYARFVARREELAGIRADALATLAYVANWRAILTHRSYWELFLSPSPLEHAWSLSIEEQFYVLWPLLVLFVLRRGGVRWLLVVTLGLTLLSMLAMVLLFDPAHTTRVYYGTDTRAAAILGGAALAIVDSGGPWWSASRGRLLDALGVLALAGLGFAWWTVDGQDYALYRGGFWLTEGCSLLLIACALGGSGSLVARGLALWPLRAVGAVSYGAYLWHWPVNLVITAERCHVYGLALLALRLAVTFGIAGLSYRLLEEPIRRRGLPFGRGGVVVPAAFAAACAAIVLGTRPGPPVAAPRPPVVALAPAGPVPVRFRIRFLGDSTANSLGWLMRNVAPPDVAIELKAKDGLNLIDSDTHWPPDDTGVDATVIGLSGAFLYGIHVRGKWTVACHPRWNELFEQGLESHLQELAGSKSRLWVSTVPYPLGPYDNAGRRKQVDCINASLLKIVARHPSATMLDLASILCPRGECVREVDGMALRPDGVHFHVPAGGKLGRTVLALVDPQGAYAHAPERPQLATRNAP